MSLPDLDYEKAWSEIMAQSCHDFDWLHLELHTNFSNAENIILHELSSREKFLVAVALYTAMKSLSKTNKHTHKRGEMYKPINDVQRNLLSETEKYNINTDVNNRWEKGVDHHPKSEELAQKIGAADWLFASDSFCFKFGGDGDNGESLMYLLDIIFDLEDAENRKEEPYSICPSCKQAMEIDDEQMASDYGEAYFTGMLNPKYYVYWCNNCEQAYQGRSRL